MIVAELVVARPDRPPLTIEIRAVIASVDTYLRYAEAIGLTTLAAAPRTEQLPQPGAGLPPGLGMPSDEEIVAYLEAHPDGVRLGELQAYFGADRTELESLLNRLVAEGAAQLDRERRVYLPGLIAEAIPGVAVFPVWLLVVVSIALWGEITRPARRPWR